MTATLASRRDAITTTLEQVGQGHLLRYIDALDESGQDRLLAQLEGIDWPEVARLIETHVKRKPDTPLPERLEPAPWYPKEPTAELRGTYARAREAGERLLREGKVAAFIVAGGQGTRLGWDAPKGTFPATPIREAPLFQVFVEYVIKAQRKYDTTIPLYVMTSPANDAATRAYFEEHNYFGLDRRNVLLFPQAMMPAIDLRTHRCLLAGKDSLALSPNGHGGSLKALFSAGAIADMKRRGVTQISYVQVDNPNVKVVDPLFLGLHELDGAQMSSKALPKAGPKEKVGNFVRANGRVAVIEYSDMPDELAEQRDTSGGGGLLYNAGSIAIHVIRVDFVESLNRGGEFNLPFHRAEKKVPHLDDAGQEVSPEEPNAIKLETFVFDALPLCEKSIILETDRVEEFAPIKNADAADGTVAPDSPASSRRLQSERAARWLERQGVRVPRKAGGELDATIEIPPVAAIEPADLASLDLPGEIAAGSSTLIGVER